MSAPARFWVHEYGGPRAHLVYWHPGPPWRSRPTLCGRQITMKPERLVWKGAKCKRCLAVVEKEQIAALFAGTPKGADLLESR